MKLAFRPADADERRCLCPDKPEDSRRCSPVVAMWSASYKKSHYAGMIWHEDWAAVMHPQISRVLARPNLRTVIAYDADDSDFIYGFIAADTSEPVPVVYYVYVKEPYRRHGIARSLFKAIGVDPTKRFVYTNKTGIVAELARKIPSARFNNNEARYPKEARRRPL